MKILVIEDNEHNLYLVRYLLQTQGHVIYSARSGREGIAAVGSNVPDLILLDIQLPQMNGYAVAQTLRGNSALDAVPIVAVTSYAMDTDRMQARRAGCDGYIEKPLNPETFANEVAAAAAAGRRPYEGTS